jgi:hypothetical protein
MADFKAHSIEDCILARSKLVLFADLSTGKVTFSSLEAEELFQLKGNEEAAVAMESISEKINTEIVALKTDQGGEEMPALRQKPEFAEQKSSAHSLVGIELSRIFASVDQFQENGVIQPTEILSLADKEFSKWVYSCCYTTNSKISTIYLLDVSEVKKEFTNLSRNPIPVDSVKKMVSPAIPDYILEIDYVVGDILSMRIDNLGTIIEIFPFSEKFLEVSRIRLFNHPIMEFIHQSDQIVLTQALSECLISGVCHFIIRWNPLANDKSKDESKITWVQIKALKSKDNSLILTVSGLLPKAVESKPTVGQQAWSFLSSTQKYSFGLSAIPATPTYGFGSFFVGAAEKTATTTDNDPKMYFMLLIVV